jgi:hypothetical protein
MKERVLIGIAIVLAAAIALQISSLVNKEAKPEDPLASLWAGNYVDERNEWKSDIERYGIAKAYEMFKKDAEGKPYGIQHTFAHIFGELIYDEEGIEGISKCDPTFAYGCYHSFSGKAILEHGLSVVKGLDSACVLSTGRVSLGCLHGIGHGILGYVGYDRLDDALEACKKTSWKGALGGCPGGVFMEYNFHTMESVTSAKARDLDRENMYAPCDSVAHSFKQECMYYQAIWWVQVLRKDYPAIGNLCGAVADTPQREACFRGLGESVASRSSFSVEEAKKGCSFADARSELLCREGAWRAFFADERTRPQATSVCADLPGESKYLCSLEFSIEESL